MVLRVGGCTWFGVRTTLSMASGCLSIETQKVASKYLHNLFKQEEVFLNKNYLDSLLIAHPQHCCRIPIASLLFQSNPNEPYHHAFIWREQPQA
jgi:hypothetical protein